MAEYYHYDGGALTRPYNACGVHLGQLVLMEGATLSPLPLIGAPVRVSANGQSEGIHIPPGRSHTFRFASFDYEPIEWDISFSMRVGLSEAQPDKFSEKVGFGQSALTQPAAIPRLYGHFYYKTSRVPGMERAR